MKLYIAVLDEFPDYMVPTLVAHSVLGAHLKFIDLVEQRFYFNDLNVADNTLAKNYEEWLKNSFKKCVVRVNQKEFDKIAALPNTYLGHENNTLEAKKACAIPVPVPNHELPNVLKFAKLWKPKCQP